VSISEAQARGCVLELSGSSIQIEIPGDDTCTAAPSEPTCAQSDSDLSDAPAAHGVEPANLRSNPDYPIPSTPGIVPSMRPKELFSSIRTMMWSMGSDWFGVICIQPPSLFSSSYVIAA
jgi:hypothetical protein